MPRQYTPRVPATCRQCGITFMVKPSLVKSGGAKYCSQSCFHKKLSKPRPWLTCQHCNKCFQIAPNQLAMGHGRYCSRTCRDSSRRTQPEQVCAQCGATFFVKSCKIGKYCSAACMYLGRRNRTSCVCDTCGAPYETKVSAASKSIRHYCSDKCRRIGIRNMNNRGRDSFVYREWRSAVFGRDGYRCQDCGINSRDLQAHHIEPWARCPERRFDVSNGITLCASCHAMRHPHLRCLAA